MSEINLTISVADEHLKDFTQIVARCRKAGMKIEHGLKTIGVISGSIAADKLDDLQRVKGLAHIERAGSFQLAPPDEDVQ